MDLEQLKTSIREEAARKRAEAAAVVPLAAKARGGWTFNWLEAKAILKATASFADAGRPPLLENKHGLKRTLAKLVGKAVLRLTRFINRRQTDYNVNVLDTVRDLAEVMHDVETRVIQQQEQIHQLEALVTQLQLRGIGPAAERKAS